MTIRGAFLLQLPYCSPPYSFQSSFQQHHCMLLQTIQFIYHLFIYFILLLIFFPLFFFFLDYLFAYVVSKVFDLNVLKVFEYLKMC